MPTVLLILVVALVATAVCGGSAQISGFSPSHFREHMALGLPATVTFHQEDGKLVLDDIKD